MYILYLLIFKQHMTVWSEMHKLGFSKTLVTLCKILNNEIYAKVKIGKHYPPNLKLKF